MAARHTDLWGNLVCVNGAAARGNNASGYTRHDGLWLVVLDEVL